MCHRRQFISLVSEKCVPTVNRHWHTVPSSSFFFCCVLALLSNEGKADLLEWTCNLPFCLTYSRYLDKSCLQMFRSLVWSTITTRGSVVGCETSSLPIHSNSVCLVIITQSVKFFLKSLSVPIFWVCLSRCFVCFKPVYWIIVDFYVMCSLHFLWCCFNYNLIT